MKDYFNQEEFNNFILENDVIIISKKPITFSSGRKSHVYVEWRKITNEVHLLDKLTDYIISKADDIGYKIDCFYGVPEGATKISDITNFKWAKQSIDYLDRSYPIPMGRKTPKKHGSLEDRYFIGEPKGQVVILEDVTTTGSSLLKEIYKIVKLKDANLISVFSLTDRMELTPIPEKDNDKIVKKFSVLFKNITEKKYTEPMSTKEMINEIGIYYDYLSSLPNLLPKICEKYKPKINVIKAIEKEFEKFGVKKIKLL